MTVASACAGRAADAFPPTAAATGRVYRQRPAAWAATGALAIVLGLGVPLFLCTPLWVDNAFFDVCARALLGGDVLYRDVFLHGPPGMVLLQAGLRWLFGWSPVALRGADLAIVGSVIWLLVRTVPPRRTAARLGAAAGLAAFYFSMSEWCHCQPDTWMLLAALAAMWLRQLRTADALRCVWGMRQRAAALAEGLCWGVAFWIKPFVALPALGCWLVTAGLLIRQGRGGVRRLAADTAWVVGGALAAAAALGVWLWRSGNWPYFVEGALGRWNQDYFETSAGWLARLLKAFALLPPWGLLHFAAIPATLVELGHALRHRPSDRGAGAADPRAFLAAVYLGWFVQANFIQRQLVYQLVPAIMLGLAVVAGRRWPAPALAAWSRHRVCRRRTICVLAALCAAQLLLCLLGYVGAELVQRDLWLSWFVERTASTAVVVWPLLGIGCLLACARPVLRVLGRSRRLRRLAMLVPVVFVAWAISQGPLARLARIEEWAQCWRQGPTPAVLDALRVEADVAAPDWVALAHVEDFLTRQQVGDGELTCFGVSAVHLYPRLGVRPSTRFVLLWPVLMFFPNHREEVVRELNASRQRFVVSDLEQAGYSAAEAAGRLSDRPFGLPVLPPSRARAFPWTEPVVFRAGRYVVHRARQRQPLRQESLPGPGSPLAPGG